MISLSVIYQGSEFQNSDLKRALTAFTRALRQSCGPIAVGAAPWISAVLLVEGSWGEAGFEGVRRVDFSEADKNVVVQIALSRTLQAGGDVGACLVAALRDACALADEHFRGRGEVFDRAAAERGLEEAARLAGAA